MRTATTQKLEVPVERKLVRQPLRAHTLPLFVLYASKRIGLVACLQRPHVPLRLRYQKCTYRLRMAISTTAANYPPCAKYKIKICLVASAHLSLPRSHYSLLQYVKHYHNEAKVLRFSWLYSHSASARRATSACNLAAAHDNLVQGPQKSSDSDVEDAGYRGLMP